MSTERLLDESERHPAAWWLDAVRREARRGELPSAFDLAERALEEHPDDVALKHRAVLALARAGATEEAARRFDHYEVGETSDEEVAALRARIAKDVALACTGEERRLGGHLGPIFRYQDPITDAPDFTGSHVTRTARIEPVTPTGAVYVTEPFAAALVLADRGDLTCGYVGHMSMAKSYGRLRMYRLRRRTLAAPPGQLPGDARLEIRRQPADEVGVSA